MQIFRMDIHSFIRLCFIVGGFFLGISAQRLPDRWQDAGLYIGIILVILGVIATLWHFINEYRQKRGKQRLTVNPSYIIAAGLFIMFIGVCWQIFQSSTPPATQAQINELKTAFDKYVRPRELTDEQITIIADFLLQRPPQKINVICEDKNSEANSYAVDIHRAFERAHWESTLTTSQTSLMEGITFKVRYPQNSTSDQNVSDDIRRAFEKIGIKLGGGSSRTNETGKLYVDFYVGHRPRG